MELEPVIDYLDFMVNLIDPGNPYKIVINMAYIWMPWKSFKVSYLAVGPSVAFLKVDYISI